MALSNDGTMLAFTVLRASPRPRLFVRPLSADVAFELPGTADARFPFWSPDNKQSSLRAGVSLSAEDKRSAPDQNSTIVANEMVGPFCPPV